jgi:hypothetical protein
MPCVAAGLREPSWRRPKFLDEVIETRQLLQAARRSTPGVGIEIDDQRRQQHSIAPFSFA